MRPKCHVSICFNAKHDQNCSMWVHWCSSFTHKENCEVAFVPCIARCSNSKIKATGFFSQRKYSAFLVLVANSSIKYETTQPKIPNWIIIIPNMMGSIVPIIINQQGFWFEHCSTCAISHHRTFPRSSSSVALALTEALSDCAHIDMRQPGWRPVTLYVDGCGLYHQ